jgi:single-strand DNA-binding protein
MSINTVIVQGYVVRDPEQPHPRITQFTLAVSDNYKDAQGHWQEKTTFVKVKCWDYLAKRAMEKIRKSDFITVDGKLQTEEYTNKDGRKVSETKVIAKALPDCHVKRHKETKAKTEQLNDLDQALEQDPPAWNPNEDISF